MTAGQRKDEPMTITWKHATAVVMAVGLSWASVVAETTKPARRELVFEVTKRPRGNVEHDPNDKLSATHVASMSLRAEALSGLRVRNFNDYHGLLKTSSGASMSQRQKEFLKKGSFARLGALTPLPARSKSRRGSGRLSARLKRVRARKLAELYAVSEDDARKMAHAVVEWLDGRTESKMNEVREKLAGHRKSLNEATARIAELDKRRRAAEQERDKLIARLDFKSMREAGDVKAEMSEQIRLASIDIKTYHVKLEAIAKEKAKLKPDDALRGKLDEMRILQSVELAGAVARRDEAQKLRDQAEALIKVLSEIMTCLVEKAGFKKGIADTKRSIEKTESILADPKPEMLPITVIDDKVVIAPVWPKGKMRGPRRSGRVRSRR